MRLWQSHQFIYTKSRNRSERLAWQILFCPLLLWFASLPVLFGQDSSYTSEITKGDQPVTFVLTVHSRNTAPLKCSISYNAVTYLGREEQGTSVLFVRAYQGRDEAVVSKSTFHGYRTFDAQVTCNPRGERKGQ